MRSYNECNQYYYNQQPVYWQSPVSSPQVVPTQPQMVYYPPQPQTQYVMTPTQYYSPPTTLQYYPQNPQSFSKSTKEIKLKRKNTDYIPKSYNRGLGPATSQGSKSPVLLGTPVGILGHSSQTIPRYQENETGLNFTNSQSYNLDQPNNFRKYTMDEAKLFQSQPFDSSATSPEEQSMKKRIAENFKLNPHFVNLDNEGEEDGSRASQKGEGRFEEDDEFDIFGPFSFKKDLLQSSGEQVPSAGPIFNLLSQTDKSDV
mmetsp:Transcript_22293/g.24800  ORF Transcript_22293/g.24800 Transcript_22293/m.24800 type:complete len:258 (+) Transcript_22293:1493-2266(+)|eukprot:CAMPEP_0205825998 /NCGR_PEP_ID=MMETSP0206-20130828/27156_1 /ASSEMBLY_ACC=CAM_ASM_000279 /TAXON_ID=36767 /ORGANISM="Euplotes focardii, Strain TN1" /LENGTH=257 /DNA_ID=CAMNT_0053125511 /DNA_START=1498 /DNA_END=2271 /DNA_ORIENTATION=+